MGKGGWPFLATRHNQISKAGPGPPQPHPAPKEGGVNARGGGAGPEKARRRDRPPAKGEAPKGNSQVSRIHHARAPPRRPEAHNAAPERPIESSAAPQKGPKLLWVGPAGPPPEAPFERHRPPLATPARGDGDDNTLPPREAEKTTPQHRKSRSAGGGKKSATHKKKQTAKHATEPPTTFFGNSPCDFHSARRCQLA